MIVVQKTGQVQSLYRGMYYLDVKHLITQSNNMDVSWLTRRRAREKLKILEQFNHRCVKCGTKEHLTIDHVNHDAKKAHGLIKTYRDLETQVLCVDCHLKKNDK